MQTQFTKRSSIYESGCCYNSTIQIVCTMAWLMKKVQTVVSKLRNKKEKHSPEVSLRKELDETKARLEKSEETIESLLKRVENLEKSRLVSETALPIQILQTDQPHVGDDPVSFVQPSEQEDLEMPVACRERNRWKFWASKAPALVYQNYTTSRGIFSNKSTGVQGQFASMSFTTETMIENGAKDDATQNQMHSEFLRQAIEMTMRN